MQSRLLDIRERLGAAIRASDDWEDTYQADPALFAQLLKGERLLERHALVYLAGFAERAPALVKWQYMPLHASTDPSNMVDDSDQRQQIERDILLAAIFADIQSLTTLGMQAGEALYETQIGVDRITELVLDSARNWSGKLITSITETNLKLIRQSIETSIALGENTDAAVARLQNIISNPVRAEMIARTETVNSYQLGLRGFAQETGAISKTWLAKQAGACRICRPLNGVTVAIDEAFISPIGPVLRPTAHPNCRCDMRYNYPKR